MTQFTEFTISKSDERNRLIVFAVIYALVWLITWYGARVFDMMGVVSLWYLPAGLRFFCLLLLGPTGVFVEVFTATVLWLLQITLTDAPSPPLWSTQTLWSVYNLFAFPLAYALFVLPLRWRLRSSLDFARPFHSVMFLISALGAATFAATAGSFNLVFSGVIAPEKANTLFVNWLTGDFIGIVTLAPLMWVVVSPRVSNWLKSGKWRLPLEQGEPPRHGPTYLYVALLVTLALALIFPTQKLFGVEQISPMVALLLLLPLAGLSLRYGLRGAVLAIVLLDCGLVVSVASLDQRQQALQYQLVMIAIAMVGLWLGGAIEASRRVVARLEDFSSISNDLLWETNALGQLTASGPLATELAIAPGALWSSLRTSFSQPALNHVETAIAGCKPFHRLEVAIQQTTRERRWLSVSGLPLWNDSGKCIGYRGTATEITDTLEARALLRNYNQELVLQVAQRTDELTRSNIELAINKQQLQVLLAAAPVGVLEFDSEEKCRYVNENGCVLLGKSQSEAQGSELCDLIDVNDRQRVIERMHDARAPSGVQNIEFRLHRSSVWCAAYWIKFRPLKQSLDNTIMVLVDASARHQQEQQLWALAHHDALTALPNRSLFLDRCNQLFTHVQRRGVGASMLWLDLDGFKSVNDTLGHAAGDALLKIVAQRLKSRVRDGDTVARMGGDEFAVLLPDVAESEEAQQIANNLVDLLCLPYQLAQGNVTISVSIGVARYPQDANTVDELMLQADSAMYRAKRSGKKQVRMAGTDFQ